MPLCQCQVDDLQLCTEPLPKAQNKSRGAVMQSRRKTAEVYGECADRHAGLVGCYKACFPDDDGG